MKNTLETRLGIFFALALVAAFLVMEFAGGTDMFKRGIHVKARFNSAQELKPGDPVKLAGVEIGKVVTVDLINGRVEVTMKLVQGRYNQVRTDSKAVIKFIGLMGQNYVAVDFGSANAPMVAADTVLETSEPTDLSSLMARLEDVAKGVDGMTRNFSGDNFGNMLGPFTDFLKENNPRLTAILGNMQAVSSQIAGGQGTIGKLVYDNQLYDSALGAVTNLNQTADDVHGLIEQARGVVTSVSEGQGTLGRLTRDDSLFREGTNAMANLREILQKINQGQGTVGKLVNDETFLKNARMTLQKVDKATEGLEDQGPLSILGLVVGQLF